MKTAAVGLSPRSDRDAGRPGRSLLDLSPGATRSHSASRTCMPEVEAEPPAEFARTSTYLNNASFIVSMPSTKCSATSRSFGARFVPRLLHDSARVLHHEAERFVRDVPDQLARICPHASICSDRANSRLFRPSSNSSRPGSARSRVYARCLCNPMRGLKAS